MKTRFMAVLTLAVCLPIFGQETSALRAGENPEVTDVQRPFSEAMQQLHGRQLPSRGLRPAPNVVLEGAEAAFIFPVVGSAGAFRTEAVIVNRLPRTQRIELYYLPIAGGASNCGRTGRAVNLAANTMYLYSDFVPDVFQEGGFGSVIVLGTDASGRADATARLDGNARIWSLASGGGTASQNFPSMSVMVPAGPQSAFGLRADEFYRTNWGIFNYDVNPRTFDITFSGFRGSPQRIEKPIPPCSLIQERVPGGPYGSLEIVFAPRDGGGAFYSYGSSVDNTSLDSFSVPGRK